MNKKHIRVIIYIISSIIVYIICSNLITNNDLVVTVSCFSFPILLTLVVIPGKIVIKLLSVILVLLLVIPIYALNIIFLSKTSLISSLNVWVYFWFFSSNIIAVESIYHLIKWYSTRSRN